MGEMIRGSVMFPGTDRILAPWFLFTHYYSRMFALCQIVRVNINKVTLHQARIVYELLSRCSMKPRRPTQPRHPLWEMYWSCDSLVVSVLA